jgi:hypothetical protein
MFGTLSEEDYNKLLNKYLNDIYIPDGFSANETNLLGHNKYFTMVVRENDKGSFGILDDLYLLKKLFLQSWRMKIFYQILSTPLNHNLSALDGMYEETQWNIQQIFDL